MRFKYLGKDRSLASLGSSYSASKLPRHKSSWSNVQLHLPQMPAMGPETVLDDMPRPIGMD
ncbi:MAG: hypothetical protein ACJ8HF_04875, partial [Pseudomonas sp.]